MGRETARRYMETHAHSPEPYQSAARAFLDAFMEKALEGRTISPSEIEV